ncbi:MAG: hypothetical protein M3P11_10890 [Actinomycetota bacterium]|nr:hypothetical protein [Actinomycetota bacterium]
MVRIHGPSGSWRRRLALFGAVATATALLSVVAIPNAFAVHDLHFQLDGDVLASTTTNVGGNVQALDWSSFFDASGNPIPAALTGGFTASAFQRDFITNTNGSFNTSDTTTFATGSKDTLSITPGWQCSFSANVNSKIDIMNAYSVAYSDPGADGVLHTPDDHQILYFGLERNANTGDGNVGFWFLQSSADCAAATGTEPFTGDHTDGDILIVSAFTKGGGVSGITAYRWNGGASGSLGTTAVANGGDCQSNLGGDTICATTNGSAPPGLNHSITTPWPTSNKTDGPGHTLRPSEFFEGGIDLTANNLGGKCFNTFIGDTRSSQSLTATLFDYARGVLGECSVSVTTTPSLSTTSIGDTGTAITDTADIAGTDSGGNAGPKPTGTMSFFLCGPGAASCLDPNGTAVTGNPVTLGDCTPDAAGHSCATSGNARSLVTAGGIGTYCFRAVYDPGTDANYQGKGGSFDGSNECFTVTGTAGLSTAQDWLPNDTATLTGDANLNGTLTFTLYHGNNCGVTSGTAVSGQQYTVTVTNAASGSTFPTSNTTFKVRAANAGNYSWLVHYDDTTLTDPTDRCETSNVSITN